MSDIVHDNKEMYRMFYIIGYSEKKKGEACDE